MMTSNLSLLAFLLRLVRLRGTLTAARARNARHLRQVNRLQLGLWFPRLRFGIIYHAVNLIILEFCIIGISDPSVRLKNASKQGRHK